jgi:hypothetical protein
MEIMTEKEVLLMKRVAKVLVMTERQVKTLTLNDIISKLLFKIENDCIDIDDMFVYMNELKERK